MNQFFKWKLLIVLTFFTVFSLMISCVQPESSESKPNVVLIFLDDGAFDDFRPFGETRYPTPNLTTLAKEGCRYYNFYVPQAICSASRSALMTGCYPGRTRVFGAHGPRQPGLDPEFATLGEVMKNNGYATACFGKWHLGDQEGRRPPDRGFDESCGLMYSNDMWKHHPGNPEYWSQWPLQYWENGEITIDSVDKNDQRFLTTWYTEHAVDFINRHKDESFFLYVPHSMPHVPIFCSDKFLGKSGTGLYGDVMMELDWSVGEIRKAIVDNGLESNTLFIFIGSDNGPWLSYGDHAGITPYREGKGTIFDGGVRNAVVIKYPGVVESNSVSHNTFCSVDLLPTICAVTGAELPENEIDGKNVWDLILNKPDAENPHNYYPFSTGSDFQGVISGDGKWKLHLPHVYRTLRTAGKDGYPGQYIHPTIDTSLFDMVHDPFEKGNVKDLYPEITEKLLELAAGHKDRFYGEGRGNE